MKLKQRFKNSKFAKSFNRKPKEQEPFTAGEMFALLLLLLLVATAAPVVAATKGKKKK